MLLQVQYPLLIFFSSRRRHTRFDCDWSSDVCSSDLTVTILALRMVRSFIPLAVLWIGKLIIDGVIAAMQVRAAGGVVDWWSLGGLVGLEIGRASCRERV